MRFIGREDELELLDKEYNRDSSLAVVYGRKRVGKTALIKQFIKKKKALYFLASEENDRQNLNEFTEKIADYINHPYIASSRIDSWQNAFKLFASYERKEKKILIIDEFQYLVSGNSAYPSIIREAWNEILKDSNVMVILCASDIGMMSSHLLSHSGPLYSIHTAQIRLQPLSFGEFASAFPGRTFAELTELYSVTGGMPKYFEFFDNKFSLWKNVTDTILNKSGFLHEEPFFLLEKEVREPANYVSIMTALSHGNHKLSKIAGYMEQKTTSISPYLVMLTELFLVEKRVPVTEKTPGKSRRGLYYISDNFIEFWFKFVQPYRSELEMDKTEYVLKKIKSDFIENHVSNVFQVISREIFVSLCKSGKIDFVPSVVGAYWNSDIEIDVVATCKKGNKIFAGECQYCEKPVSAYVYLDLQKKCSNIPEFGKKKIVYGIFSKSGFDPELIKLAKETPGLYLFDKGKLV
ncbi:MAG: ATP-binding protein [Lachnospiraceae bacterium]|nr:ATP-binding protein [Lachnospiraceae bacterium]